jgi:hypothetical protein
VTSATNARLLLAMLRGICDSVLSTPDIDLTAVRRVAARDYPSLLPVIDEFAKANTPLLLPSRGKVTRGSIHPTHLFDLLRDDRLFPSNAALAQFATRILPKMYGYRFDKMARSDIVARIIEYLETIPTARREKLEASMRQSLDNGAKTVKDRSSFISKWEQIIKNIEL